MNLRSLRQVIRPRLSRVKVVIFICLLLILFLFYVLFYLKLKSVVPRNQQMREAQTSKPSLSSLSSLDNRNLSMVREMTRMAWKSYVDIKNKMTEITWRERRRGLQTTGFDNEKNLSVVKEMTRMAWKSYIDLCALKNGGNELAPLTNSCSQASDDLVGPNNLLTVIDSLDTLILMGLNEEFQQGRDLVERMFNPLATPTPVNVFETTIRILGGLLGAFSLTEDQLFARLATQVGNGLADAFNDGRFSRNVIMKNALMSSEMAHKTSASIITNIAEVGSLYLEFAYLSEVSGDPKFHQWVDRNQRALLNINNMDGLLPVEVVSKSAWKLESMGRTYSIGAMGDSYYEYLVKRCLFDVPSESSNCVNIYSRSLDGIMKHLKLVTTTNNVLITKINDKGIKEDSMEHLTCFAGGMFALAYLENKIRTDWLEFAKKVTETCYLSYFNHPMGLGSEMFYFDEKSDRIAAINTGYLLRPETVESIYYLYMATGNQMYKDWGWNIIKALNSTAVRTASGFSGMKSMNGAVPVLDNVQYSFFLAETVKYLYLLFLPSDALPLEQWLFNTEAHVIPNWRNPLRQKLRSRHGL